MDEHFQACQAPHAELTLYLDARLGIAPAFPQDVNEEGTLGLIQCAKPLADELRFPIAREQWAREIGPALGHDRQRLVVLRLPSAEGRSDGRWSLSYNEASRHYDRAEWRESIQKCRDARTYVERAVRRDEGEKVAAAVARRLGTDGEDPRIKFLDSIWTALVNLTSGAHHVDSRDRLEAATAHAALLVTATMVQHVAELIGPPSRPAPWRGRSRASAIDGSATVRLTVGPRLGVLWWRIRLAARLRRGRRGGVAVPGNFAGLYRLQRNA